MLLRHPYITNGILASVFGMILLMLNFFYQGVLVYHWYTMQFKEVTGFHPLTPVIGLSWAGIYVLLMVITPVKEHWSFWVVAFSVIIFNIILFYVIINTIGLGNWLQCLIFW